MVGFIEEMASARMGRPLSSTVGRLSEWPINSANWFECHHHFSFHTKFTIFFGSTVACNIFPISSWMEILIRHYRCRWAFSRSNYRWNCLSIINYSWRWLFHRKISFEEWWCARCALPQQSHFPLRNQPFASTVLFFSFLRNPSFPSRFGVSEEIPQFFEYTIYPFLIYLATCN